MKHDASFHFLHCDTECDVLVAEVDAAADFVTLAVRPTHPMSLRARLRAAWRAFHYLEPTEVVVRPNTFRRWARSVDAALPPEPTL